MEVNLLDFVEQCRQLFKQALSEHAGETASGGLSRWKHVVIHFFGSEEDHSFCETENRVELLDLEEGHIPDFMTLNKSFDRFKVWAWRALLRASSNTRIPDI